MKHRGHGEGSIVQRKDGRWQASIRTSSVRKYVYATTRDEAQKKLRAILNAQDAGEKIITPSRITVGKLLDRWLDYQKTRVRPNTLKSYKDVIECHIRSQIGSIRLTALTPYHIEHTLSRMNGCGGGDSDPQRNDGGDSRLPERQMPQLTGSVQSLASSSEPSRGDKLVQLQPASFSPRTIRYVRQVMFMALKKAVQWELVRRNAAEAISGPKRQRSDIHPLTDDELARFLSTIKSDRLHAMWLMAVSIGLRKGELLGLKWTDLSGCGGVDSDTQRDDAGRTAGSKGARRNGDGEYAGSNPARPAGATPARILSIRRTLQHGVEYEPKTESSRRTIRLPTAVITALDRWRFTQLEMRMKAGGRWREHGYVYATPIGTPLDQRNVSRYLDAILAKCDPPIPHHRFHDLRHTCATMLLRRGARLEDVSKLLGHASKAMTLDVYSHAIGNGSEVASLMDQIIG